MNNFTSIVDLEQASPVLTVCVPMRFPQESAIRDQTIEFWIDKARRFDYVEIVFVFNGRAATTVSNGIEAGVPSDLRGRISCFSVLDSSSKAANVNRGLIAARGEVFAIFDADSRPTDECLSRGTGIVEISGGDVGLVQGVKIIRRPQAGASIVERIVYSIVELEHCINYWYYMPLRLRRYNHSYCAGSNMFARTKGLCDFGLDEDVLVEDVDLSMRVAASGGRSSCDVGLICFEDAPPNFSALVRQRRRWFNGWMAATRKNGRGIANQSLKTRDWRLAGFWLVTVTVQIRIAISLVLIVLFGCVATDLPYALVASITIFLIWLHGLRLMFVARRRIRASVDVRVIAAALDGSRMRQSFGVFLLPFYVLLMLSSWIAIFVGKRNRWEVTPRSPAYLSKASPR